MSCRCHVGYSVQLPSLPYGHRRIGPVHLLALATRLMVITPGILLSGISEYIRKTWEIQLDPDELDLRWNDSSGDTGVLSNNINIIQLLTMYRPSWCREQDIGTLLPSRPFTDFTQPYIMRLSCHRALREGHLA